MSKRLNAEPDFGNWAVALILDVLPLLGDPAPGSPVLSVNPRQTSRNRLDYYKGLLRDYYEGLYRDYYKGL